MAKFDDENSIWDTQCDPFIVLNSCQKVKRSQNWYSYKKNVQKVPLFPIYEAWVFQL